MNTALAWLGKRLARYLAREVHVHSAAPPTRLERLLAVLKPGDVLLVEGNSKVSSAIKYLTQPNEQFPRTPDLRPAVYRGMINKDTELLHHLFNVTKAQWVSGVPDSTHMGDFQRIVEPLEHLAWLAIHRYLGRLYHVARVRHVSLRQNHLNCVRRFLL